MVGIGNDTLWQIFCKTIGKPELCDDDRFVTNQKRTENLPVLNEILITALRKKTAMEWLDLFADQDVPCAPINQISNVIENRQVQARNMIVQVEDKVAGCVSIAGNPIKMTNIPEEGYLTPAPEIGEHNAVIFKHYLGLTAEDLDVLTRDGVI